MLIVLIEDNAALARGIAYRMEDGGHAVDLLSDGLDAEDYLRGGVGDLIILDINLPRRSGLALLREMRRRGDARPVILLTARADTDDRVACLDAGADDYLVKPFEMAELEARVRALSRRSARAPRREISCGPLTLDIGARSVTAGGSDLDLPRRELSVLETLMSASGRTVSKEHILDRTYGTGADVEETVVEVHVSRLRKRLRPHGMAIRTRRGLGYALVAEA